MPGLKDVIEDLDKRLNKAVEELETFDLREDIQLKCFILGEIDAYKNALRIAAPDIYGEVL